MDSQKKATTGAQPHRIRVGLAGWSYDDWNGIVYPSPHPRDFHEVTFLAQFFDTIEINTSFYQPLKPQVATHWIGLAAENPRFLFTAKMWQKFTHETGATSEDEKLVRAGFDRLFDAGKLGAVLLQFPFFVSPHYANTGSLEATAPNLPRVSARSRSPPFVLGTPRILRTAARTRRRLLQYRPARDRQIR